MFCFSVVGPYGYAEIDHVIGYVSPLYVLLPFVAVGQSAFYYGVVLALKGILHSVSQLSLTSLPVTVLRMLTLHFVIGIVEVFFLYYVHQKGIVGLRLYSKPFILPPPRQPFLHSFILSFFHSITLRSALPLLPLELCSLARARKASAD